MTKVMKETVSKLLSEEVGALRKKIADLEREKAIQANKTSVLTRIPLRDSVPMKGRIEWNLQPGVIPNPIFLGDKLFFYVVRDPGSGKP